MLDILMSRSNIQVRIDEIKESVTEKKKSLFPLYSELSKYA